MEEDITESVSGESNIDKDTADEIRELNLDERAEYVFVSNVYEVSERVLEVEFETPFHKSNATMRFAKPGFDTDSIPSIESLYSSVSANILEPRSIMHVSIPKDADVIGNLEFESSGSELVPDDSMNVLKEELGVLDVAGSIACLSLAVLCLLPILNPTIWSVLISVLSSAFFVYAAVRILRKDKSKPRGTKVLGSSEQVSEGSIVLLEKKSGGTLKKERIPCEVVEVSDSGLRVVTEDGVYGWLRYEITDGSKTWSLRYYEGIESSDDFQNAYIFIDDYDFPSDHERGFDEELQQEIRDRKLSAESDYVYVDRIEELDDELVKVYFEESFGDGTRFRIFSKTGVNQEYKDLTELYNFVGADITDPESVIGAELSRGSEVLRDTEVEDRDVSELLESERSITDVLLSIVFAMISVTVVLTINVIDLVSFLVAFTAFLVFFAGSMFSYIEDFTPISDSNRTEYASDIEVGDIIVLDSVWSMLGGREVCRVLSEDGTVRIRDGRKGRLIEDEEEGSWKIKMEDSDQESEPYFDLYIL